MPAVKCIDIKGTFTLILRHQLRASGCSGWQWQPLDRVVFKQDSHTSTDARALRPIALAGEGYHLVLVPASCSLLCRHHVIEIGRAHV